MSEALLPSWREGGTRQSIVAFLDQVDQSPPHDRVAVFDNDGTMWAEKPNYTQLEFFLFELQHAVGEDFCRVKPEGVVGSQIDYEFTRDETGAACLLWTNGLMAGGPNEGPRKPSNIQRILGRGPCVAGGNSAGDAEMLEYAMAYDGPSLALLVNRDDGEREYAYESVGGTFAANESITDTATRPGCTVASIKNDWSTVYAVS